MGMAPCPTGHSQHCDCCWGSGKEKPSAATAIPGKRSLVPSSPLAGRTSPLCPTLSCGLACLWASRLPPITSYPQKPGRSSLAQVSDRPSVLPREVKGTASTCCKDFNPIAVTASSDKSMQQRHEMRLISSYLQKGKNQKPPFF